MRNILVIDDSESVISVLSEGLGICLKDWRVLTAENGKVALEILESVPVDFILTDLRMPTMDGYEFLTYARRAYPSTPMIAMTADCGSEIDHRLHSLGITEVMRKPFSIKKLAARILESVNHGVIHNFRACISAPMAGMQYRLR